MGRLPINGFNRGVKGFVTEPYPTLQADYSWTPDWVVGLVLEDVLHQEGWRIESMILVCSQVNNNLVKLRYITKGCTFGLSIVVFLLVVSIVSLLASKAAGADSH